MSVWDERMRKRVSGWQEASYGELAEAMGLGWAPREAFARLAVGVMPPEAYSPPPGLPADGFDTVVRDNHARYVAAGPPTPYEDPTMFALLCELADLARQMFVDKELPPVPPFAIGSLPSGRIHAKTSRVGGNSPPVILVEQGLITYFHAFATCIGAAMPIAIELDGAYLTDVRVIDPGPQERERARQGLEATLSSYVVDGEARSRVRLRLSPEAAVAASLWLRAMELFVVGHEVAHVFYRHLHKGRDVPEEAERLEQELGCDAVGVSLTLAILGPGFRLGPVLAACVLALHALEFVERTVTALGGPDPDAGYPPLAARRRHIVTHHLEVLDEVGRADEVPDITAWLEHVDGLCDTLWTQLEPAWRARHAAGVRPSRRWSATP